MKALKVSAVLLLLALMQTTGFAVTVMLAPQKDNTLYEDSTGSLSNGRGVYLYTGKTGVAGLRRGLIAFDLTGIPFNAVIQDVTLSMFLSTPHKQTDMINVSL